MEDTSRVLVEDSDIIVNVYVCGQWRGTRSYGSASGMASANEFARRSERAIELIEI